MNNLVNLWQTNEERQNKYHLALSLGVSPKWARVMRDWRLSKIERKFGLNFYRHYRNAPVFEVYAQFRLEGFDVIMFDLNPAT